MKIDFFVIGAILFYLGLMVRGVRWQLLLPADGVLIKSRLVLYCSIGGLVNGILPFRVGDLLRATLLSKFENVRIISSLASVFIERMTDLAVLLLIVGLYKMFFNGTLNGGDIFIAMAILLGLYWVAISFSKRCRKIVYLFSSIWNERIKSLILDFLWTIINQINHARFLTFRYISLTIIMWTLYVSSYFYFYKSLQISPFIEVWDLFHGDPIREALKTNLIFGGWDLVTTLLMLYLLLPVLLTSIFLMLRIELRRRLGNLKLLNAASSFTTMVADGVPMAFSGSQAYQRFLIAYFSGENTPINRLGEAKTFDANLTITRLFSGGSGAVTAVVEAKGHLSIMKMAEGELASKLISEYEWLKSTATYLPVVNVLKVEVLKNFTSYMMPYEPGALDLYEWLHTAHINKGKSIMIQIIDSISTYHKNNLRQQDESIQNLLQEYLNEKLRKNYFYTKSMLENFFNLESFFINGDKYSFEEWDFLLDFDRLKTFFLNTQQSDIHGDLTIENIIMRPDESWMLIDPNPLTSYKSPLMDWAKLLQSLNMGYEFLNRQSNCDFDSRSIKFISNKSHVYHELHNILIERLNFEYGNIGVREAKLHEIIHYLRLIPYKFKKSEEGGMLFFAVTCKLIRDFKVTYAIT
ncbi:lysylphosphatidylglycerol synthase transmembrane domain-containing protein [Polynucleobacter sp. MWH-Svant-W18]|uniref:lysylphosphatidylglycerol synthase transmembrane domain-containing protein n=1 Tax=Polynucleobacter sp. MWH-Svant-W18 TaxID=1855909 RepID=UPI001BFCE874|nr:lysylphosphatidylglycerol synthase transmembrane domain-containing protein [Polynucleobacter sp. MWH-Svant-W18]